MFVAFVSMLYRPPGVDPLTSDHTPPHLTPNQDFSSMVHHPKVAIEPLVS